MGIKRALLFLALVVAASFGGIAVYVFNLDVNEYRNEATQWVRKHTGRELEFHGPVHLKLALIPTLVAYRVSLSNAPWGSRPELARVDRLEARVALLSLLDGELRFSRVAVEGADILLEVNEQGVGNWKTALAQAVAPAHTVGGRGSWTALLHRVLVKSSTIRFRSRGAQKTNTVEIERLRLVATRTDEKLRIAAAVAVNGTAMRLRGKVDRLMRLLRGESYAFDVATRGMGLESTLNGMLTISDQTPRLEVDVAMLARRPEELPAQWRHHVPVDSTLEGHAVVGGTPTSLSLTGLDAELGEEHLQGEIRFQRDAGTLRVEGALRANRHDLRRWLAKGKGTSRTGPGNPRPGSGGKRQGSRAPVEVALDLEIDELTSAQARAKDVDVRFGLDHRGLTFSSLSGEVDFGLGQSRVRGNLQLVTSKQRPRIEGTLHADRLDLGPWLSAHMGSPESQASPDDAAAKPGRVFSEEPLDLGALGIVDAALKVNIDEVWGRWTSVRRVEMKMSLDDSVLRISPVTAEITGGVSEAAIRVEGRLERPRWQLSVKAAQLEVGRLFDETPVDGLIEGRANVSIEVEGEGRSVAEIAGSLDGHARVLMGKGHLVGEAAEQMAVLDSVVGGLTKALGTLTAKEAASTTINCLATDFELTDGIAVSQLMLADTEYSTVRGEGRIDLGEESLELKFHPRAKSLTLNVAVPVDLNGTLSEPSFSLDNFAIMARVGSLVGLIVFPPAAIASLGALGVYGAGMVVGGLDLGGSENDCLRIAAPDSLTRFGRGNPSSKGSDTSRTRAPARPRGSEH